MKRLVQYQLGDADDGGVAVFEVEEDEDLAGPERVARWRRAAAPEDAGQRLEDALDRVQPAANAVVQKIRQLANPADECTVEFGIKLNAQAGAVIASTAVEAHYKVVLTWRRGLAGGEPAAVPRTRQLPETPETVDGSGA